MAIKTQSKVSRDTPDGFDVTFERVIGRVQFGTGEHDPQTAAMILIGNNADEGTYRFTARSGGICVVTISYDAG